MRRALAALGLLAVVLVPTPALATCTPTLEGSFLQVACDAGDDALILERDADGNVLVNGEPSGANVVDLDTIGVETGGGNNTVTIDETGGLLAPGAEPEAEGDPEIEVAIASSPDSCCDEVVVIGQLVGDDVVITGGGIDVNGDGDLDLLLSGIDAVTVDGSAGNDHLDASGLSFASLEGSGGLGFDTLVGGGRRDTLNGGPDDDRVAGGPGKDDVSGDDGHDVVAGGAGPDVVVGGDGRDTLLGGLGDDDLNGGPKRDTGNGGKGDDRCRQIERTSGCES